MAAFARCHSESGFQKLIFRFVLASGLKRAEGFGWAFLIYHEITVFRILGIARERLFLHSVARKKFVVSQRELHSDDWKESLDSHTISSISFARLLFLMCFSEIHWLILERFWPLA